MGLPLAFYTQFFLLVSGNKLMAFQSVSSLCLCSPGCQVDRSPSNPPSEKGERVISRILLSVVSVVFFHTLVLVHTAWLTGGPFLRLLLPLRHLFLRFHGFLSRLCQPLGFPFLPQSFILLRFRVEFGIGIRSCFLTSLHRLVLVLEGSLTNG